MLKIEKREYWDPEKGKEIIRNYLFLIRFCIDESLLITLKPMNLIVPGNSQPVHFKNTNDHGARIRIQHSQYRRLTLKAQP